MQQRIGRCVEGEAVAHALGKATVGLGLPVGLIRVAGVEHIRVDIVKNGVCLLLKGHVILEDAAERLVDLGVELLIGDLVFYKLKLDRHGA